MPGMAVLTVMAVPVMHEEVHQWTSEQKQEWQIAKYVSPVFRK